MRLAQRRALVTGASSGIGRAIALAFAREAAAVVVNYRASGAAAEQCVAEICAAGGQARALQADVADPDAVDSLVEDACTYLGGLDIWVNAAGADILTGAGATASDVEKLQRLVAVDLLGTIQCCWAASKRLSSGGSIINMSWDLALRGMPGRNPEMFAAVKAGVSGYTRALARSLAPQIRVNEIAPGWIETRFAATEMSREYRDAIEHQTPLQRLGSPQDVADAAVYLASEEASFVTGQTLKVNGGLSS